MIGLVDGNKFFVSCERVVDPKLVGRAVAVLSNNDGCCVSRSNEFKARGIPMGTPYFQLKDRERSGELVFKSSNYELYADISRRIISILRAHALDVEQYSIDEAFIYPPTNVAADYAAYGMRVRRKILRWTGIPCGVGFAPTKTLAKIANHIGKKTTSGVYVLPQDPTEILSTLPVEEVWGIGRRLASTLHVNGIHTAEQFRHLDAARLRELGSVTLVRTAQELNGIACITDRDYDADPDSITCSRSFGERVTTREALVESIAVFTAQAACKLRRHGLLAAGANVFAQAGSACESEWYSRTVAFEKPTDNTLEMLAAVRPGAEALFVPGLSYRKSGMMFFGLEKPGKPEQLDLFRTTSSASRSSLYKAVDALNARYGKGVVFAASEGLPESRTWAMRRENLSRRATTRWDELLTVR